MKIWTCSSTWLRLSTSWNYNYQKISLQISGGWAQWGCPHTALLRILLWKQSLACLLKFYFNKHFSLWSQPVRDDNSEHERRNFLYRFRYSFLAETFLCWEISDHQMDAVWNILVMSVMIINHWTSSKTAQCSIGPWLVYCIRTEEL